MDTLEAVRPPSKIQTIGILHLVGGVLNLFSSMVWLISAIGTFGLTCCPAFLLLGVAFAELWSAYRHLGNDHRGLAAPRLIGILELFSALACNPLPVVAGILTLVFLNDPEVQAYYAHTQSRR